MVLFALAMTRGERLRFPHPCRGALLFHTVPGVLPPATILHPSGVTEASVLYLYTL